MFIWPTTTTRVTSQFRPAHRKNHNGIDIAEAGKHEVFAVADGVVSRSYVSTSYGEVVFIVHNINGQTWESVYAHLRTGSRRVKEGQKVKQGQVIGIMGNTGRSTGQHLHFELHRGRWNVNKTNAVDPLLYLNVKRQEPTKLSKNVVIDIQKWIGAKQDGIPGPETWKKLLMKLQSELNKQFKKGLKIDGIWGPKTSAAVVSVSYGAKGNITKVLQAALYLKGYTEVGKIDGNFGNNTKKALGNFQRNNKVKVDYVAGKQTFAKLFA